jgi:hypothetical protein
MQNLQRSRQVSYAKQELSLVPSFQEKTKAVNVKSHSDSEMRPIPVSETSAYDRLVAESAKLHERVETLMRDSRGVKFALARDALAAEDAE